MLLPIVSNAAPLLELTPESALNHEYEWEALLKKANAGEITRDEARGEFSRLIKQGNRSAIEAQHALIADDKSLGKIPASAAYDAGKVLYNPMSGDSSFMRG